MFTEPQTVTVDTVGIDLPRIDQGNRSGLFQSVADGVVLKITHVVGRRNRSTVRFEFTKTAADPLLDGVSRQYSMSVVAGIDNPLVGFSATEVENNLKGAVDWMGVLGNRTKLINGES